MATVMRICGDAFGRPTGYDGQYLRAFDFEAHDGLGSGEFTPDLSKAMQFASMAEALIFFRTTPKCKPLRTDGRPNRPLTSTNWEMFDIPD